MPVQETAQKDFSIPFIGRLSMRNQQLWKKQIPFQTRQERYFQFISNTVYTWHSYSRNRIKNAGKNGEPLLGNKIGQFINFFIITKQELKGDTIILNECNCPLTSKDRDLFKLRQYSPDFKTGAAGNQRRAMDLPISCSHWHLTQETFLAYADKTN